MDFIEGLPQFSMANAILVVVDKFSKFAHFLPLKNPFSAVVVAKVFFDMVFCLHGLPKTIISDRDCVFTSRFWQLLFRSPALVLASVRRTTHKLMVKPSKSTSVLRPICVALYTPVQLSGVAGFSSPNNGTSVLLILQWVVPPLRFYTAILLGILGWTSIPWKQSQTYKHG